MREEPLPGRRSAKLILLVASALTSASLQAFAQQEQEARAGGTPLENQVAGREWALRVRAEMEFTEDDQDLIEADPGYAAFPSEMYETEVRAFHSSGFAAGAESAYWQNPQGLRMNRYGGTAYVPFDSGLSATVKLGTYDATEAMSDIDYYVFGVGKLFQNSVYSFLQYRHFRYSSDSTWHQVSEYVSWTPNALLRLGFQAGAASVSGTSEGTPWFGKLFGNVHLVQDWTSVRIEAQHYESIGDVSFDEYKAYIYQKIYQRSLLRLGYRLYEDNSDNSSDAWSIQAKRYFSPRFSAHIGYRYYVHSEGADFDSLYAGFGLIL